MPRCTASACSSSLVEQADPVTLTSRMVSRQAAPHFAGIDGLVPALSKRWAAPAVGSPGA